MGKGATRAIWSVGLTPDVTLMQAMKTVEKKGLQTMAKEAGLDLYSLPFEDARPQRLEWLAQQPTHPPVVLCLHHLSQCRLPWAASKKRPRHQPTGRRCTCYGSMDLSCTFLALGAGDGCSVM